MIARLHACVCEENEVTGRTNGSTEEWKREEPDADEEKKSFKRGSSIRSVRNGMDEDGLSRGQRAYANAVQGPSSSGAHDRSECV